MIGPTQLYGYAAQGADASPEQERAYIESVRERYYSSLAGHARTVEQTEFQCLWSQHDSDARTAESRGAGRNVSSWSDAIRRIAIRIKEGDRPLARGATGVFARPSRAQLGCFPPAADAYNAAACSRRRRLNLDIDVDQRDRGGRYAGNARGLAESLWDDFSEFFLHLAGQSAHRPVIEPFGNVALLGLLQAFDGALLLIEVSGILDFGFDGLELVADFGGKSITAEDAEVAEELLSKNRAQILEDRRQLLDRDFRALQQLRQRLANRRGKIM